MDQNNFKKALFSVDEIENVLNNVLQSLLTINSDIKIIFTVSPVRHLKDGFIENQQSKAHLIAGIHKLIESQKKSSEETCFYFPAYEIMLDELRDYRFYGEDMIHPSTMAIDYIWTRFTAAWLAQGSLDLFPSIEKIHKGLAHKPFNINGEKHQLFLENLDTKILDLKRKIPFAKFNFSKIIL